MDPHVHLHRQACEHFSQVIATVGTKWDLPSPCADWTARGVLEHVIGFHEVLILRPLAIKVHRPKDDIPARWTITQDAVAAAIENPPPGVLDLEHLLPALTTDVVVHTWDLAKAIGTEPESEESLIKQCLASVIKAGSAISDSGLYDPPVEVAPDAPALDRLVGLLGRDPEWHIALGNGPA